MININIVPYLFFAGLLSFVPNSYAKDIAIGDGINIVLPNYENERVNPDDSGSVCVDVNKIEVVVTICLYSKASDKIAQDNGFIKYGEFSSEGKNRISPLPDDALIYVDGGYGALYETRKEKNGDFIVYEAMNTLCDVSGTNEKHPAVCYVAALISSGKINVSPAIFVSAILEQPPISGGKLSRKAMGKVGLIKKIIKSIRIGD
ncbi:hypothetical protein ACVBGC_33485 [Burkholderia stagnalis]